MWISLCFLLVIIRAEGSQQKCLNAKEAEDELNFSYADRSTKSKGWENESSWTFNEHKGFEVDMQSSVNVSETAVLRSKPLCPATGEMSVSLLYLVEGTQKKCYISIHRIPQQQWANPNFSTPLWSGNSTLQFIESPRVHVPSNCSESHKVYILGTKTEATFCEFQIRKITFEYEGPEEGPPCPSADTDEVTAAPEGGALSAGAIAAIVIPVLITIIVLLVVVYLVLRHYYKRRPTRARQSGISPREAPSSPQDEEQLQHAIDSVHGCQSGATPGDSHYAVSTCYSLIKDAVTPSAPMGGKHNTGTPDYPLVAVTEEDGGYSTPDETAIAKNDLKASQAGNKHNKMNKTGDADGDYNRGADKTPNIHDPLDAASTNRRIQDNDNEHKVPPSHGTEFSLATNPNAAYNHPPSSTKTSYNNTAFDRTEHSSANRADYSHLQLKDGQSILSEVKAGKVTGQVQDIYDHVEGQGGDNYNRVDFDGRPGERNQEDGSDVYSHIQ